jgi:hypothetical protein
MKPVRSYEEVRRPVPFSNASCEGFGGSEFFPRRIAPSADTSHSPFGAELSKSARDRGTTDGWQRTLKIGVSKLTGQSADDVPNHVPFRAALGARRAHTILELSISLHQHHTNEVFPPGDQRVLSLVPPASTLPAMRRSNPLWSPRWQFQARCTDRLRLYETAEPPINRFQREGKR